MEQVGLLADLLGKHPQSIEILPGELDEWVPESISTYPFLFAEGNLGIPQKVLYNAYMVAIRAYSGLRNESLPSLQQSNLLDRLTRVVLLANPAHQTALNSRKKLVQKNIMQPHWELGFSGSLLSCRECTKESILWHHRRWLLHVIYGVPATAGTDSVPETVPVDALEAEFACASTACHLYPRNYHAWAHRRFCAEALVAPLYPEVPSKSGALVKEYQWTLKWIESHVSDYSAMNHAVNFEQMLAGGKPTGLRLSTKVHAASLLRSYPDHESLWMYLRGSIPNEDEDKDEEFAPMKGAPSVQKFALRHVIWRKIFQGEEVPLRSLRSALAGDHSPEETEQPKSSAETLTPCHRERSPSAENR